jgi:Domain of unknown function (DUF4157)
MHERAHDHERDGLAAHDQSASAHRADALDGKYVDAAMTGRVDILGPAGVAGLQRIVGNETVSRLVEDEREAAPDKSPVHDVINSGGEPLAADTRAEMEGRLGADFSDVRIHTDSRAHDSAKSVNAHAYTVGNNIVFQRDAYDPASHSGRTTLAHELTHVMQQRSGPVDGEATSGGVRVSDPSDRFERAAVANAEQIMSQPAPAVQRHAEDGAEQVTGEAAPAVQRQEDEEAKEEE